MTGPTKDTRGLTNEAGVGLGLGGKSVGDSCPPSTLGVLSDTSRK